MYVDCVYAVSACCRMYICMRVCIIVLYALCAGQPLLCRCLGLFLTHNNKHAYTRIDMYAIVKIGECERQKNRVIHGHIEENCCS